MRSTILITGASSGIGLETAIYLARRGHHTIATMRDMRKRGVVDRAAANAGVSVEITSLDVTDPDNVRSVIQSIERRGTPIDAVVNNAGIQIRGYFEDLSEEEIRRVFETNVFGTMTVTREVLPYMRERRRGRIVLVTSVGGRIGSPGLSAYCSTKFALEGFGECLAIETAPFDIHVSMVEPGIINTAIWKEHKFIADRAAVPESPYRPLFAESERMADWAVETSKIKVEHAVVAIHKALTARRPRLRYLIGVRPGILLGTRRILPGETFDRIYRNLIKRRLEKAMAAWAGSRH